MTKKQILSTIAIPHQTLERFNQSHIEWFSEDFIKIELLDFRICPKGEMLVFTSKNAVRSVLRNSEVEQLRKMFCICVGEQTKELLEKNGFKVLDSTHYAKDLTSVIAQKYTDKSFLFFCGNKRREILPDFFKESGLDFVEVTVYQNKATPVLLYQKFDGLLFFSPSGVASYLSTHSITDEVCFCIGTTTAQALEAYTSNIVLADKPTINSILKKAVTYFTP